MTGRGTGWSSRPAALPREPTSGQRARCCECRTWCAGPTRWTSCTRGRPEGVATLASDEPNLTAVIRSTDRGQLQLVVDTTPESLTQEHRLRFPVERSVLPDLVRQCRAIVKAYPVRDPDGGRDS